jgi:lipopolysaccharide/colanic/teichoic acid biosynthesis glycosyltransferase
LAKKIPLTLINEEWFLENIIKKESRVDYLLKRSFDIFFACFGLLVVIFLFPFLAFLIKIDSPGSIFYSQKRLGKDKKIFTLYKFRTMKEVPKEKERIWREKEKDQITRVGKFLRKTHLDELPQCWNILKGELSFVGPRPEWIELAKIFEKEIPFYSQRYLIKPEFTGWAQLNFPPSISVKEAKEKFEYDIYYLKKSFFLF